MLEAFIICLREGFESFLIVAITVAYLRKTERKWLSPAVYAGIAVSIVASSALGYFLSLGVMNQAFWEGVLGLVAVVVVGSLVVHMWRTGPRFKQKMEEHLLAASSG